MVGTRGAAVSKANMSLVLQAKEHTVEVTRASVWNAVCSGVSPHVLSNFLVLGLPGGVMMAADACSFDVTTVMASILGTTACIYLPAQCVCLCHSNKACWYVTEVQKTIVWPVLCVQ